MQPELRIINLLDLLTDAQRAAEEVGITDVEWETRRRRVGIIEAELERMRTA